MKMKFIRNKIIILLIILILNNYITSKLVKNLLRTETSYKNEVSPPDEEMIEIKEIIDEHNKYRNQIALSTNINTPKLKYATNMIQMYYSRDIAKKAQHWANKQKFAHSDRQFRRQPGYPTGENLYYYASSGKPKRDWKKAIKAWFDEIKNMPGKSVDAFSSGGPVTGHFTQIIWAYSYIVGCGFVQYPKGGMNAQIYVCQYGPVGNIIGMPIYKSSTKEGCNCDAGLKCKNMTYRGLCCKNKKMCRKSTYLWEGKPYQGTVPNIVR